MKKKICCIILGLFAFLNAQGNVTTTLGTNDATTSFQVLNSDDTVLWQTQGNGWTGFGTATPMFPFHLSSNYWDINGDGVQQIGFFENTVVDNDGIGLCGHTTNSEWYGIGLHGAGGYRGVLGTAFSEGADNEWDYYGVYGFVEGGNEFGLNRGVGGGASNGYRAYGGYFQGNDAHDRSYGARGEAGGSPINYGFYGEGLTAASGGTSYGVFGDAHGDSNMNYGVLGRGGNSSYRNIGVMGEATGAGETNYGVYGAAADATTNYAGFFQGNVKVTGDLTTATATYKIDHPLDPANKYLSHSFVESSDMMNIYNGNVELNYAGEAEIELPNWFESLNSDFRYQITAIGSPGPNLYVAQEVSGNSFRVAGGEPGMKVSWQITGVRKDAYANANRIKVEEYKTAEEIGKYLHPEVFGMAKSQGINIELPHKEEQSLAKGKKRMKMNH